MIDKKKIEDVVNQCLEGSDKYLIDVEVSQGNIIEVIIDGDNDISIDDCVELSRYIEGRFDRERDDFELRVSSAGLNRPFDNLRQYRKYLNRPVEVITGDSSKLSGILLDVNEEGIDLEHHKQKGRGKTERQVIRLSFEDIKKAKPGISFRK